MPLPFGPHQALGEKFCSLGQVYGRAQHRLQSGIGQGLSLSVPCIAGLYPAGNAGHGPISSTLPTTQLLLQQTPPPTCPVPSVSSVSAPFAEEAIPPASLHPVFIIGPSPTAIPAHRQQGPFSNVSSPIVTLSKSSLHLGHAGSLSQLYHQHGPSIVKSSLIPFTLAAICGCTTNTAPAF
jgi:hypothetical protein